MSPMNEILASAVVVQSIEVNINRQMLELKSFLTTQRLDVTHERKIRKFNERKTKRIVYKN
ncbi:CLUMA_CG006800, isoform A [Clunio marinus]|uniref:CLUMA_CG006800, isoform A n=1 Tax=Clunio marinus TaxID=568069 RepID=A0A1J1I4E7_9DIPT|nr:CLUMA_CG006800, isoform A [Clunio marinus]